MAIVDLPHGTLHYHDSGSGVPIVFLHGYLMGANLWDPVIQLLEGEFRCLTPELPFGAYPSPTRRYWLPSSSDWCGPCPARTAGSPAAGRQMS